MSVECLKLDQSTNDADFEYHAINAKEKNPLEIEPVIVLFGWGGCHDKYLSKYSLIYEEKGCSTFRCIVPTKILFPGKGNEAKLHSVAEKIVIILQKLKFEEHPLYFHCFSNGGSSVYCCVSKIIHTNSNYNFQVKGCIFDSAPAKVYASNIIAAVVEAVKGSKMAKYSSAFLVLTYMYTVAGYTWVSSLVHCETPSSRRFILFETLANEPNICPQLFLFSKVDDVCPYESIQEFINIRKKNGVDVTAVLWENSPHVKHLVAFREQYVGAVFKFVKPYIACTNSDDLEHKPKC